MRRLLVCLSLLIGFVASVSCADPCEPDCSKGIRQRVEDVVTIVCETSQEAWSIESKAEVISSKIDDLTDIIAPELWSIESKAEVISSKIDTITPELAPELWSIESKAEVISSKIDILVVRDGSCGTTPITQQTIISESGSYCLANEIDTSINPGAPVIAINASDVVIDFNGHVAHGRVEIGNGADQIIMLNGVIDATHKFVVASPEDYCVTATNCSNLVLRSMTLRDAEIGLDVMGTVTKLTIENSIITNNSKYGVRLTDGVAVRLTETIFYDGLYTATGFAMTEGGNGFDIRGCLFEANALGIYMNDVHSGHIEGVVLSTNQYGGLLIKDSHAVDIQNVEATRAHHGDNPAAEGRAGNGFAISGGHAIEISESFVAGYDH
ncbi:right-handed parallel beta-helix repeat-containing protein [Methylicorpusculum sp.]|uniref:right-handed parallel beta-helix repeat-containing protein n=1 Tax=Methylicorpusculum sp. TaxID=2713644 RepID=UPI002AB8E686|nr:right-handed parallel beta-helix repeat-containing protein [Methylicorpusculum sp.]MDZ4152029.1 right-handed parallel beta-helix repeat-containing protein [Methylicorpusculum sp.]